VEDGGGSGGSGITQEAACTKEEVEEGRLPSSHQVGEEYLPIQRYRGHGHHGLRWDRAPSIGGRAISPW
jgi:hypothetical protein